MKPTSDITLNGKTFPMYEIEHPETGDAITIANSNLLQEYETLIEGEDKALRAEAERVDEQVYCYMDVEVFEKPEDEVVRFFTKHFD